VDTTALLALGRTDGEVTSRLLLRSKLSVPMGIVAVSARRHEPGEGGGVPVVETLSVEEARRRRDEVLASVGGDECDLRERAARYMLDAEELAALTELDELDFLLSE
jgi:hypothetical protein